MKNRLKIYAIGLLVATTLIACSDASDAEDENNKADQDVATDVQDKDGEDTGNKGDAPAQDSGGTDDTELPVSGDAGTEQNTLSGVWAQKTVMSAIGQVPIIGQITTTTNTIQKVEISGSSPNYTVKTTPCAVVMDSSSSSVKTVVPDAFVRGLMTTERTLTTQGNTFEMPVFWEARGVRLTDVEAEAMPTDKEDTRIFDQDGDGKPGMTIRITGIISGDIYVIQRGSTQMSGQITNQHLDGLMVWTDEQVILGSDNSLLASNQPEIKVDPKAENSFFQTTRLSGNPSCTDIITQTDTLFAR